MFCLEGEEEIRGKGKSEWEREEQGKRGDTGRGKERGRERGGKGEREGWRV